VTHDVLTGLPNRLLLADRLGQSVSYAARLGKMVAVLFFDLDRFKRINDNMGHNTGDLVLREWRGDCRLPSADAIRGAFRRR
jgi:diguanylate cyclase (GGDEF)-like protein